MKTRRISARPDQVDLHGLPAARLRAVLLALSSPEAAEVFDAQLADLHAEWLAARERSGRLRAAWIALCIRAHLTTCAAYYLCASLGLGALRNAVLFAIAAYFTLAIFSGLAHLIAPRPAPPPTKAWPLRSFTRLSIADPPRASRRPVKPPPPVENPKECETCYVSRGKAPPVIGDPQAGPSGPGGGWGEVPKPPPLEPALGRNFMCLPMVRSEPDYPEGALRRRIEGEVVVDVAIDRTGSVSNADVLRSEPEGVFDAAVLRAVRRWRYKVSDDSGASCDRAQVRLRFELPSGAR